MAQELLLGSRSVSDVFESKVFCVFEGILFANLLKKLLGDRSADLEVMADDGFIRKREQKALFGMDIIACFSALLLRDGRDDMHRSLTVCPEAFFIVLGIGKPGTDVGSAAREMQTVRTLGVSVF